MHILLFLIIAANVAAQGSYVIDLVCAGTGRVYRIDTKEKGSTWEWYLKDSLGVEIDKPVVTEFWEESSPGDTTWGSEINILWNDIGKFYLSTLHFSSHGCDTLEQGWVEVFDPPVADAGKDIFACVNSTTILSTDSAWHFSSVFWTSTGDGFFDDISKLHPTYFPGKADSISGNVMLILTANGKTSSETCKPSADSMQIRYSNPAITLTFVDLLCYNDSSGWAKASVEGGIEPYKFNWTGPGVFASTNDSIFGLAAGKYIITVTDSIGCTAVDSVEITEPLQLLTLVSADIQLICDDDSIHLKADSKGGTGKYVHLWTGNGATYLNHTDSISPNFAGAITGVYKLFYTVTDENGCTAIDSIDLTVLPKDTITTDTVICGNEVPFAWLGKDYFNTNTYTDTLTALSGCDTIAILNLTVLQIDTITFDTTICITDSPFAWYGKDYFISGNYVDTLVPATGCDTILILNLKVTPKDTITIDTVICGTDTPFALFGKDYFKTSIYVDTLPALVGCDTTVIINLTVLPIDTVALDTVICGIDAPFAWYGLNYYTTGIYTDTLNPAVGCDTILILDLTVLPIDTAAFDTVICGTEAPFAWNGKDYMTSGIYTDTLLSAVGCDTILILDLTVLPIDTISFDTIISVREAPFVWYGKDYFTTGIYTDTLTPAVGCETILILDLTVLPIDTIAFDTVICISETPFVWNNKDYFTTAVYTDTLASATGRDTILILDLTVLLRDTVAFDTVICGTEAPFAWYGKDYFTTGIYTDTLVAMAGCDTILILDLTVLPIDTITFDTVICGTEAPFAWNGKDYMTTGIYTDTLLSAVGCDTILIIDLTVMPSDTISFDTIICTNEAPFAWYGKDYFTTGIYTDTLSSATGCDTILILDLTVNPSDTITFDTIICINEAPFAWYGKDYFTTGIYTDTLMSATGCDSILILDLTVNPSDTITFDTTICRTDVPFAWYGKDYFTTGIYTDTLAATAGCDTILILDLTVLPIDTITFDTVICGTEAPFAWNGKDYMTTGIYTYTLLSTVGCDTILMLDLTVLPTDTISFDTIVCSNELPFEWNGKDYFTAGIYIDTLSVAVGCDTIKILDLKVLPEIAVSLDTTICASETPLKWYGKDYFTTAIYTDTLVSATGCDTVLILDLTVLSGDTISFDTTICANEAPFAWYGKDYFISGIYSDTLAASNGCDTILMLDLKVLPSDTISFDTLICASDVPFTWYGKDYFTTDIYTNTLVSANGCDTILILDLTVLQLDTITFDTVICMKEAPLIWYAKKYFTTGIYYDTLANVSGCNTILILDLKVIPAISVSLDTTICISEAPLTWYGKKYFTTGIYLDTLFVASGCDTVLMLDLKVLPEITVTLDTTICESYVPFKLYGNEYFKTGIYHDTIVSAIGCKTILNLNLKVIDEVTPLFVQMGPYYQYSKAPNLPLISFDGVKGTWNPSTIETSKIGTVKYVFTPDDGECAVKTSIDITIKAISYLLNCPPDTIFVCDFDYDAYPAFTRFSDFKNGGGSAFSNCGLNLSTFGLNNEYDDKSKCPRTIIRTYEITDSCGNYMFCNQKIIVHDKIPPEISCPPTLFVDCFQDVPAAYKDIFAFINDGGTASDNCGLLDLTSFKLVSSKNVNVAGKKEVKRRYSIKDMCGNESYCDHSVIYKTDIIKPVFAQIGPLCQYSIAPKLPLVSANGITGTWIPATINTSKIATTTYYFIPDDGQCAVETQIAIEVTNEIKPVFAQIGPLCQNSIAPLLPTVSTNGIKGTWNPAIIDTKVLGTIKYTFTPAAGQCGVAVTMDIEIIDEIKPVFTQLGPLCLNSTAPVLPKVSTNGITGTWNPAVINTSVVGTTTYNFTPNAGQCAVPVTMNIEIIDNIKPLFAQLGPLCQNSVAPVLPTVSTNGITGIWNPAIINTSVKGITAYKFTPGAGQCAVPVTMNIEISDKIIPLFAQLGPLCLNSVAPLLPLVSENGITGTWSPSVIKTSTYGKVTYTFTPDAGQCSPPTTLDIVITPEITPTFAAIGPLCLNSIAPALPLISNNTPAITGTWSPSVINTSTAGKVTYTFTPDAGQCATTATLDILVTPELTPTFNSIGPLCQNAPAPLLPTVSTNGIKGTWNPSNIDTKVVGKFTYTFTPAAGQCAVSTTINIVVTPEITPVFKQLGPLCQNGPAPVLPAISSNGIKGTWNPAVIDTKLEGLFTYTFTPATGQCAVPTTMIIEITPEITPVFAQLGTLCQNSAAPVLPVVSTNGIKGTWSPNTIKTSVDGIFTFKFTPAVNQCATPVLMKIEITKEIKPLFTSLSPVCPNSTPPLLPVVSTNGITGTWNPSIIETSKQGTFAFTFTPDSGQCATKTTIDIEISDKIPPVAICRNITVYLDSKGKTSITTAQINNGSNDNCKLDTVYLSKYNFGCADVGKNKIKLTAVDAVGLSDFCEATVTVLDTIKPVVVCRGPFEIQLDENAQYKLTVAEVLDTTYDACGIDTMYVYPHELDCDHIGLTTITLWVVGVNGDSSYCQTEVMIYGNRAPNVVDDSAKTKENIPVIIEAVLNDYDEKTNIDISSLSVTIKPLHGTVSVNPLNGDFTYKPNRNFSGVDVLEYRICDDGIPCDPECGKAFVYITVEPVNEKPVAVDDYYDAGCFSVSRNVLDNDTDPDGTDNLLINTAPLTPPNHGSLIIDVDGTINYFPNEGYIGIDSFQYIIWDNGIPPLSDTAWVYISVDCNEENANPLDCELFIPEGFSPNEDGIHDFFRIMCIHNYPDAKLMIYNRNGNLLWEKEHYGNYDVWGDQYNAWWWGTSVLSKYDIGKQSINGEPKLKVGNYVYVLMLGGKEIRNGTVMISY